MPTCENGLLQYEAGQSLVSMVALTDSGDHTIFNSAATLWSNKSGKTPNVKPDGLATGGTVIVAASGSNNVIDTTALTCYLAGVLTSVNASTDNAIVRGVTNEYTKHSIQVTSGGAIAIVDGTEHTSFSDVRDAAGGPPYIVVGSIEIGQIHCSTKAAAAVTADEIKMVPGTHTEWYNYPAYLIDRSRVSNSILGYAGVDFYSVLPLSHTAAVPKKVYAEYYTPAFAAIPDSYNFVRPANSYSVNSSQVYGGTKGSSSTTLGQGSFSAHLGDGVSDNILGQEGANLWFKFQPDRLLTPYVLCQGILGVVESYPADNSIEAAFTISAEYKGDRIIT
jgi:hypothetical protein